LEASGQYAEAAASYERAQSYDKAVEMFIKVLALRLDRPGEEGAKVAAGSELG
jgi:hypothetical protein